MDLNNIIIIGLCAFVVYNTYASINNKESFNSTMYRSDSINSNESDSTFNSIKSSKKKSVESFTGNQMRNYPNMLKKNCYLTTDLHKKLKKLNYNRCGAGTKGKTYRETINNKRLCYDDIHKEIVTGFDAESNCVVSNLINNQKNLSKKLSKELSKELSKQLSKQLTKLSSVPSTSIKATSIKATSIKATNSLEEGPEFINKYFVSLYQPTKTKGFSEIQSEAIGLTGKYANINSYNDIGFTSDPSFLYRLSTYNKLNSRRSN